VLKRVGFVGSLNVRISNQKEFYSPFTLSRAFLLCRSRSASERAEPFHVLANHFGAAVIIRSDKNSINSSPLSFRINSPNCFERSLRTFTFYPLDRLYN